MIDELTAGYLNVTFVVEKIHKDHVVITTKGYVLGREYFWHTNVKVEEGNSLHIHQKVELSYD